MQNMTRTRRVKIGEVVSHSQEESERALIRRGNDQIRDYILTCYLNGFFIARNSFECSCLPCVFYLLARMLKVNLASGRPTMRTNSHRASSPDILQEHCLKILLLFSRSHAGPITLSFFLSVPVSQVSNSGVAETDVEAS